MRRQTGRPVSLLHRRHIFVMIVPLEQLLNRGSLQFGLMVQHLLRICVFPLRTSVLRIEVVLVLRRHKRRLHSLFLQCFPVEASKPGVFLDHVGSFASEPTRRLPLYELVNEVGSLETPPSRDLILANHDLLRQNVIAYLLPISPLVRTPSIAALVRDDSHGEVVDGHAMILPAHHFGRHIAWRARSVLRIFRVPQTGDSQVGHPQVPLRVKDKIFGFDIAVQNHVFVQIFQAGDHASDKEFYQIQ